MVIDFALPTHHDLERGYREYVQKAKKSVMDYGLHMAVTRFDAKVGTCDGVLLNLRWQHGNGPSQARQESKLHVAAGCVKRLC